jgi:divalent metal cation (Fe/Co/Zn/Cd) transporter
MSPEDETGRASAVRMALRVEYFTVAWMIVEAGVAIASGVIARSIALVAFGLDSVIELFAAAVVIWQLRGIAEEQEARETLALRLIAATFFALAAYVTAEAVYDLVVKAKPETSVAGIVLAAAAVIVMPVLFVIKKRLARRLDNAALGAEASESLFCGLLAAIVLLALGLNAALGWWWADPVAALVVAVFAVREGFEALEDATFYDQVEPVSVAETTRDEQRPAEARLGEHNRDEPGEIE